MDQGGAGGGNERKGVGDVRMRARFELASIDSPTRAATTAARLARSRVVRLLCHHLLCVSANWLFMHTVPPSSRPPSASPRRASMVVAMLVASTRPPVSNASLAWVVRAELCGGAVGQQHLCLSTASTTRTSSQISEDDCFVLPLPFSLAVLRSIPGLQRSRHARSERCSRGVRTTTSRSERVKRTANTGVTTMSCCGWPVSGNRTLSKGHTCALMSDEMRACAQPRTRSVTELEKDGPKWSREHACTKCSFCQC